MLVAKNSCLSNITTVVSLAVVAGVAGLLTACSSSKSESKGLELKPSNLVGTWQVSTENSNHVYVRDQKANQAGYTGANQVWQYKFSKDSVQMTVSDDVSVKLAVDSPYQIRGSRIEPTQVDGQPAATVVGMTVTHVFQDHIDATLELANNPNQVFRLQRIADSEFSLEKIKPTMNTLKAEFLSDDKTKNIEQSFINKFGDESGEYRSGCRTLNIASKDNSANPSFGFSFYQPQANAKGELDDGIDAHVDMAFAHQFDFSKPSEEFVETEVPVTTALNALLKKDAGDAGHVLYSADTCKLQINRQNRNVDFTVSCFPVVTPLAGKRDDKAAMATGELRLTGKCTLDF